MKWLPREFRRVGICAVGERGTIASVDEPGGIEEKLCVTLER